MAYTKHYHAGGERTDTACFQFKPRWWQRKAYIAGLNDARRVAERQVWAHGGVHLNSTAICTALFVRACQITQGRY